MFELRDAVPEDAEAIAETLRLGFDSFRPWAGPSFDPPPAAAELRRVREGLAEASTWALVALAGGEAAGHVAVVPARKRAEPRAPVPGLAHLWMLFVRPPWWGSGLAPRLLERAVAHAGGRGFAAIRLLTPAGHGRARAFYEREGWATDGVALPDPLLGIDLVEYRRDL